MRTNKLSNNLLICRLALGLSQKDVSRLLGCHSNAKVSRYERGARTPSLPVLVAYEIICGRPLTDLFANIEQEVRREVADRARALDEELAAGIQTKSKTRKRDFLRLLAPTESALAPKSVMAFDTGHRSLAFVLLREPSPTLLRWGILDVRGESAQKIRERAVALLKGCAPSVIVLENCDDPGSLRNRQSIRILRQVQQAARKLNIRVVRVPRRRVQKHFGLRGAHTQQATAEMLAKEFPELLHRLPEPRELGDAEDERLRLFSALALAVAHLATKSEAHDLSRVHRTRRDGEAPAVPQIGSGGTAK